MLPIPHLPPLCMFRKPQDYFHPFPRYEAQILTCCHQLSQISSQLLVVPCLEYLVRTHTTTTLTHILKYGKNCILLRLRPV
jgi:hypothetical protein